MHAKARVRILGVMVDYKENIENILSLVRGAKLELEKSKGLERVPHG